MTNENVLKSDYFVFSYLIKKRLPGLVYHHVTNFKSNGVRTISLPDAKSRALVQSSRQLMCTSQTRNRTVFFSFLADCYIEIDSCTRLPPRAQHCVQPLPRELWRCDTTLNASRIQSFARGNYFKPINQLISQGAFSDRAALVGRSIVDQKNIAQNRLPRSGVQ